MTILVPIYGSVKNQLNQSRRRPNSEGRADVTCRSLQLQPEDVLTGHHD